MATGKELTLQPPPEVDENQTLLPKITNPFSFSEILQNKNTTFHAKAAAPAQPFKPFSVDYATTLKGNIQSNLIFGDFVSKQSCTLKPIIEYCGKRAILFQQSDKLRLINKVTHVLIDVTKPLLDEVWIEFGKEKGDTKEQTGEKKDGFWQTLSYGSIPSYCVFCCHIGHSWESCKQRNKKGPGEYLDVCCKDFVDKDSCMKVTGVQFSGVQSSSVQSSGVQSTGLISGGQTPLEAQAGLLPSKTIQTAGDTSCSNITAQEACFEVQKGVQGLQVDSCLPEPCQARTDSLQRDKAYQKCSCSHGLLGKQICVEMLQNDGQTTAEIQQTSCELCNVDGSCSRQPVVQQEAQNQIEVKDLEVQQADSMVAELVCRPIDRNEEGGQFGSKITPFLEQNLLTISAPEEGNVGPDERVDKEEGEIVDMVTPVKPQIPKEQTKISAAIATTSQVKDQGFEEVGEVVLQDPSPSSWADQVDEHEEAEKEEQLRIIHQLRLSEVNEYAKKDIEKIMGTPTNVTKVFDTRLPIDFNPDLLDGEGCIITWSQAIGTSTEVLASRSLSPAGRSSKKLSKLRKRVDVVKYMDDTALLVNKDKYDQLTEEWKESLLQTFQLQKEARQTREKAVQNTQKVTSNISQVDEQEDEQKWTTAQRRGRNRNKKK